MSSQTRARGGEDEFWPDAPDGPRGRLIGLVLAVVVLLAAVGGGAWWFLGRDDGDGIDASAGERLPLSYVSQPADKDTAKLNDRATDARPFTEGEIFEDKKKVSYKNHTFELKGQKLADCPSASWGPVFEKTLADAGCTQIARGLYLSTDGKYAGLFVAFNLADEKGANLVMNGMDVQKKAGFVHPLESSEVKNFGGVWSAAYSSVIGHYVIMSWVQRADGARPDSINEMIDTSLAVQSAEDFAWQRLVLIDPQDDGKGKG
ncbi:hypothetical protein [Actinocorallia lasiicapitis]